MKLSVIIPAYNAEKEIGKCINSILNTNHTDFEVIVVNDGSTDNTKQILDRYLDSRLIVIHKENEGVSVARNIGIKNATGDYVLFVDADDELEPQALDYLTNYLLDKQLDLLQFSVSTDTYSQNSCKKNLEYYLNKSYTSSKEAFLYLINHGFYCVWNKLYRREFIENITFPKGIKTGEDFIFNCNVFLKQPVVSTLDKILYHHIRTEKETTVSRYIDNMDETLLLKKHAFQYIFKFYNIELKPIYYNNMLLEYKFYVTNLFHNQCPLNKKHKINKLRTFIFSKETHNEIKNAVAKNKSSKIFKFLVQFTNLYFTYLFYSSKTTLKIYNGKMIYKKN